jgi:hypothetical protein
MAKLIVNLIGRICIVQQGNALTALFMDTGASGDRAIREHRPLLATSLDRIAQQSAAETSLVTIGAVLTGSAAPKTDSIGIWSLDGYEMTVDGVANAAKPARDVTKLADLGAIVDSVAKNAAYEQRILSANPKRYGIAGRFVIPDDADVTAVVVDAAPRKFVPGGHTQQLADFVTCSIDFANALKGPTVTLRRFGSRERTRLAFKAQGGDVTMTLSNLCNCVEQPLVQGPDPNMVLEDREFRLYYKLVKSPKRIARPTPEAPAPPVIGGVRPVRCYYAIRLDLTGVSS